MMKLVEIKTYRAEGLCTLEFVPVERVPGYSHRVVIDGVMQGLWLPEGQRPDRKHAIFFMRVWGALRDGLPKYHYADRGEDPPARGMPATSADARSTVCGAA